MAKPELITSRHKWKPLPGEYNCYKCMYCHKSKISRPNVYANVYGRRVTLYYAAKTGTYAGRLAGPCVALSPLERQVKQYICEELYD